MKRLVILFVLAMVLMVTAVWAGSLPEDRASVNSKRTAVETSDLSSVKLDIMVEGFETSVPPPGWTAFTNQPSDSNLTFWQLGNGYQHTGEFCAVVPYGEMGFPQDEWLISGALDFSGFIGPKLSFYEDEDYWADWGDHHYVMVCTTDPSSQANFTAVATMTPANHEINGYAAGPTEIDLSAYAGEPVVYVAFRYVGEYADNWFLDDVRVFEPWDYDVRMTGVAPVDEQLAAGDDLVAEATFQNVGLYTLSCEIVLNLFESGTLAFTYTIPVADLTVPEGERTVAFPGYTVSDGHYYTVEVEALMVGDGEPADNTLEATNNTFTRARVPLAQLITNASCDPCAVLNPLLDDYMVIQANTLAMMRLHGWWPGDDDAIYLANLTQNNFLINYLGADYAPHLWLDGTVDLGSSSEFEATLNAEKLVRSPLDLELGWSMDSENVTVHVTVMDNLPPDHDYRLRVAFTEDDVYFNGGNGEPVHQEAFRYMFPETAGLVVSTSHGLQQFVVHCPLDESWVYEKLRVTVYVQDDNTGRVLNASTCFLNEALVAGFLASFDVAAVDGSARVSWQASSACDLDDFRLTARTDADSWGVTDLRQSGENAFAAVDSRYAGTDVTYTLFYRGSDIGSRTLKGGTPDLVTALLGAYPNPFNPMTQISFTVDRPQNIRVELFDVGGRKVAVLADDLYESGTHDVRWEGRDLNGRAAPSGSYFVRMIGEDRVYSQKIMLVR